MKTSKAAIARRLQPKSATEGFSKLPESGFVQPLLWDAISSFSSKFC
jgi:hypothetical protein